MKNMSNDLDNLSPKEVQELCLKEGLLIKRMDPITEKSIFIHNFDKIGKMVWDFDFLVEGAARGRAVNEISKIERHLFEHDNNKDLQKSYIASYYSNVSFFLNEHQQEIDDKNSENWRYIFINYFKLKDIYWYFTRKESASDFFSKHKFFKDYIDINFNLKMMNYLTSQVELEIPVEDDKDLPAKLKNLSLKLLMLYDLGIMDLLIYRFKDDYLTSASKLISLMLDEDPLNWRVIMNAIKNIGTKNDKDIVNDKNIQMLNEIYRQFGLKFGEK